MSDAQCLFKRCSCRNLIYTLISRSYSKPSNYSFISAIASLNALSLTSQRSHLRLPQIAFSKHWLRDTVQVAAGQPHLLWSRILGSRVCSDSAGKAYYPADRMHLIFEVEAFIFSKSGTRLDKPYWFFKLSPPLLARGFHNWTSDTTIWLFSLRLDLYYDWCASLWSRDLLMGFSNSRAISITWVPW